MNEFQIRSIVPSQWLLGEGTIWIASSKDYYIGLTFLRVKYHLLLSVCRGLYADVFKDVYVVPTGARESSDHTAFPFFNIESPSSGGVMVAIGWTSKRWNHSMA